MFATSPRRTLGKYEIIDEVGRGGFGVVYKARDTILNRLVAIKVLKPVLVQDPAFIMRFQQEAQTAAGLEHPNIVTIYELGEHQGSRFIAMQYLEGQSLAQVIAEQGCLSMAYAQAILKQVASALDYAHSKGLIHRDVKPSNILISADGHATLTDFGLVKATLDSAFSSNDQIIGSPQYMSPEQAESKSVDGRSDIYALGIVLFEMVTGQTPFQADSTPSMLYKQVHEIPPRLRTIRKDLPESIEPVFAKGLAKKPEQRFSKASDLATTFERAIAPYINEGVHLPTPRPFTRYLVLGGIALVVCLCATLLVWAYSQSILKTPPNSSVVISPGTAPGSNLPVTTLTLITPQTKNLTPPQTPFINSPGTTKSAVYPTSSPLGSGGLVFAAVQKHRTVQKYRFQAVLSAGNMQEGKYREKVLSDFRGEVDGSLGHWLSQGGEFASLLAYSDATLEMYETKGKLYYKGITLGGADPSRWYSADNLGDRLAPNYAPNNFLNALGTAASSFNDFKITQIDPLDFQTCEVYVNDFSKDRTTIERWTGAANNRNDFGVITKGEISIWLCADGLIHRQVFVLAGFNPRDTNAQALLRFEGRYWDFDSPAILITLPNDAQPLSK